MSVIVRNMPMPSSCSECLIGRKEPYCPITGYGKPAGKRSIACPLLPISEEEIDEHLNRSE